MHYYIKINLLIIISFIISASSENLNDQTDDYEINYVYYNNEICSFSGKFNTANNECNCDEEYYSIKTDYFTINHVKIQCSQLKKRQVICLFFSIFLPFGASFIYLGHIPIFIIYLLLFSIAIIGNCIKYTSSSTHDYFISKTNIGLFVLLIIMFLCYLVNIFLVGFNLIPDSNNEYMISDLSVLFDFFKEEN